MSYRIKVSAAILGTLAFLIMALALFTPIAHANPLAWLLPKNTTCQTAAATTTQTYMTAGTATTTLTCDTASFAVFTPNNPPDNLYLRVYQQASSTASIQAVRIEYSDDGTAGSWFANSGLTAADTATSTYMVSDYSEYRWAYASTTPGAQVIGNANSGGRTFEVPMKARYVRVMAYVPVGATNSSIWMALVAKKQEK